MNKFIIIGFGGFIGSILRYVLSGYVQGMSNSIAFPYGTIAVNLAGCLIIGFLSQIAESQGAFTPEMRGFLFVGLLGGFTTFSTFGNETFNLMRDSEYMSALFNLAVHIMLGLGAVWLGHALAYSIWR